MTVSSREHLPINTEKLLPGARSAALLWQGAALLGGAALGVGQVYGGAAPFGLALVIGCPPAYCVAAALGTLAAGLAFQPALLGIKLGWRRWRPPRCGGLSMAAQKPVCWPAA